MKRLKWLVLAAAPIIVVAGAVLLLRPASLFAHCQIPCGIYNDDVRFTLLREHLDTLEKSIGQITDLASDPSKNANQIARWVMNKEDHANFIVEIVTEYFLQQRVKVAAKGDAEWDAYTTKLAACHGLLVNAMKAKQTTDLETVKAMRQLVDQFEAAYHGHALETGAAHAH